MPSASLVRGRPQRGPGPPHHLPPTKTRQTSPPCRGEVTDRQAGGRGPSNSPCWPERWFGRGGALFHIAATRGDGVGHRPGECPEEIARKSWSQRREVCISAPLSFTGPLVLYRPEGTRYRRSVQSDISASPFLIRRLSDLTQELPPLPDNASLSAEDFSLRADQAARRARKDGFPGLAAAFDHVVNETLQPGKVPSETDGRTDTQEDAP